MYGDMYCRACYSSDHVMTKRPYLKEHTLFVNACSPNYLACFGMEWYHRKQTLYLAGRYSLPYQVIKGYCGLSTSVFITVSATRDLRLATVRSQTVRNTALRLTVRPTLRRVRGICLAAPALVRETRDWECQGSALWMQQLLHQRMGCTEIRQEALDKDF